MTTHNQPQNDARTAEEKAIDEWLPVTSERKATWWYSAFHNITAMVGAGVLGLPYAMSELGWGPGVTIMILSWVITLYTLWQMVEMHEMVPGKRFDRYHELGQHAFGEKLGLWIVVPQQVVVEVSTCIVYMVTGGKSLNFHSLSLISLSAAVMSLSYSTIAWVASVTKGQEADVNYGPRETSTTAITLSSFNALGDVAFAFAGHNVVLEIQATIPSTPDKPSKKPMWRGVILAYLVVALCYFPVAFSGYYSFGNKVDDNILVTLQKPSWLIATANMFVVVHVIGSYQVYAMPVFDMLETFLVKKLRFKPSTVLRFTTRTIYVGVTMFVAIAVPFFGGLMGFFGGLALAPTTYYLPCIMWLVLYKPKRFGLSWCANWVCIVVGIVLMILAPIGGLRSIILSAKNYKMFS
ncbi:lysine histidine transporter-like 2 [Coffea arabica]|uniref:Lysine histidine transporter-like 2 n=1 Tax=Coffea arabica TaxID=13443 RepID=A0ABM4WB09_COFAR